MPDLKETRAPSILAVDGGASKTEVCLVGTDGAVLGRARGAASNHQMVGLEAAMVNLEATIAAALSNARVSKTNPCAETGIFCLAGIDLPIDESRVGDAVRARAWVGNAVVQNDTFALLRAGSPSGWGVAVVCGTGLNCVARGPTGSDVRFPSLGELSGDFTPGGMWLGVRGLGLALRAGDGRGPWTVLRTKVAARFGMASVEEVLHSVYEGSTPFGNLAEVAEDVLSAAAEGDDPAADAAAALVDEVVAMASAAMTRAGFAAADTVPLIVGGGLFSDDRFCTLVATSMKGKVGKIDLRRVDDPPVLGAALLGLDAIGLTAKNEVALRSSLSGAS